MNNIVKQCICGQKIRISKDFFEKENFKILCPKCKEIIEYIPFSQSDEDKTGFKEIKLTGRQLKLSIKKRCRYVIS
jgi:hypothetical protein